MFCRYHVPQCRVHRVCMQMRSPSMMSTVCVCLTGTVSDEQRHCLGKNCSITLLCLPVCLCSPTTAVQIHHGSWLTIFRAFAVLGWTAFGGPAANIALFHNIVVEDKK